MVSLMQEAASPLVRVPAVTVSARWSLTTTQLFPCRQRAATDTCKHMGMAGFQQNFIHSNRSKGL